VLEGGIYVEPALKVAFSDGNRDLALHYVSQTTSRDGFVVVLKDISREIFVGLHYTVMKPQLRVKPV
jgi:alpha-galactosidase